MKTRTGFVSNSSSSSFVVVSVVSKKDEVDLDSGTDYLAISAMSVLKAINKLMEDGTALEDIKLVINSDASFDS